MLGQSHRRWWTVLAVMAVAGLLWMHGLDPLVTSIDQAHGGHSTEAGPNDHGVLGLCVFVTAAAALALSRIGRVPRRVRDASPVIEWRKFTPLDRPVAFGLPLLHRLCVLRL